MFQGESAHAAAAPWRGRSALDAVELMDVGWNFRREHLRLATRVHYVITNGGDQPNVVPPNASVWYYFREADYDHIMNLWRIGDNMAKAATLMTDTTFTSRVLGTAWPGHFNVPIAEDMYENIRKVGMPQWSDEDQTLAKALQKELKQPESGLAMKIPELRRPRPRRTGKAGRTAARRPDRRRIGRYRRRFVGSPDRNAEVPLEHSRRPRPQLGERNLHGDAHRAQRRGRGRESAGDDDARYPAPSGAGAKGLGLLQQRPDQGCEVQESAAARRQACHLAEPENNGTVPAAMKALYYDPSKYDTYLEQLGIKYPTIR